MTEIVEMHVAMATLTRLVERARAGEEIIIAKGGKSLVALVPIKHRAKLRVPGKWRGKVWMAGDFDPLPDGFLDAFEGKRT